MPRDGSGSYSRAVSDYVTGTTISSSDVNTEMDDFAAEITNSVDKDGQTVYTGSHDWNGNYMITDVGGDSKVGSPTDDQWDIYLSGAIKHKQTVSGYEFSSISNPTFLGNDTDGVITFSPNTGVLGGIAKLYGDTHATKPGDIEFLSDTTVELHIDGSTGQIGLGATADDDVGLLLDTPARSITANSDYDRLYVKASGAVTVTNATTSPLVATARFDEPKIVLAGSGAVTDAATVWIAGAPTEGGNNYALRVDSGAASFGGSLTAAGGGSLTGTWADLGSVTTVDINGGTIDGASINNTPIGGSTPAAISGTTGDFSGKFKITSSAPTSYLVESGASADSGKWRVLSLNEDLLCQTANDAESAGSSYLKVTRTGTTVDSIELGNSTNDPDVTVYGDVVMSTSGKRLDLSAGSLFKRSVTTGITAGTTQTQAGATALATEQNYVDTVATNGDGVKLPSAEAGLEITIVNRDGAQTLQVWPASGDGIDNNGTDAADSTQIAAQAARTYVAYSSALWTTKSNQ